MKKILLTLFYVVLAILLITSLLPKPLVAETPEVDLAQQLKTMQDSDPLFNKIGYCESHNIPTAKNPHSTAKGRYQFLDGTWKWYAPQLWGDDWVNKDVFNYTDNTNLAWFVYTNYGTGDWEADPKSYNCWKSEIPNAKYKDIY